MLLSSNSPGPLLLQYISVYTRRLSLWLREVTAVESGRLSAWLGGCGF